MGHRTALSTVEEFGLIDALYPGRLDLGLGRSGRPAAAPAAGPARRRRSAGRPGRPDRERAADPAAVLLGAAAGLAAVRPAADAAAAARRPVAELHRAGRRHPRAARRDLPTADGIEARVVPGEGADVQVWILGSSGGESAAGGRAARAAVRRQLPRQPGHGAGGGRRLPGRVRAVGRAERAVRQRLGRRRGRRGRGDRPGARRRLRPVGAQHPHRRGRDPVPHARRGPRARVDRRGPALVADRVDTQFVGSPGQVADQLETAPRRHRRRRAASSPRSPTTTPTGSAPTSCSPRNGSAGKPHRRSLAGKLRGAATPSMPPSRP